MFEQPLKLEEKNLQVMTLHFHSLNNTFFKTFTGRLIFVHIDDIACNVSPCTPPFPALLETLVAFG